MKVEEIKTYRCSDGAVFDSKDVAESQGSIKHVLFFLSGGLLTIMVSLG